MQMTSAQVHDTHLAYSIHPVQEDFSPLQPTQLPKALPANTVIALGSENGNVWICRNVSSVFEIFYLYILNPESREKLRRIVFPISQIHAFPGQSTKWICLA